MIIGIIQARMGSTRLPGKVLAEISGRSLISHVVERCAAAKSLERIVVATTDSHADDRLVAHICTALDADVFRGSTNDVLDRFYQCALRFKPEIIVRITADDPLKDPEIIDRAVELLRSDESLDYCSNTIRPTFPEGLDIEAFRFPALAAAASEARLASEREHVTPFIWSRPQRFRIHNFEHEEDLSAWRLTVDKPADLKLMRAIFGILATNNNMFSYRAVIDLLKQNPQLREINSGTIRNEGYLRSLQEEE